MSINSTSKNINSLLFEKCLKKDINFIRQNCDFNLINIQNSSGLTLTALACLNNDTSMLLELLKFLPNVNLKTKNGHSPVTFAIANNNLEHLKLLIEDNDEFDFYDQKIIESALLAIIKNQEPIVEYLIHKGLDIGSVDKNKNNILMYACRYNSLAIAKLAISKKININNRNSSRNTALLIATERNHHECVKLLIDSGALINVHNKDNLTPLIIAVKNQNQKIIELLIYKRDLIVNAQDNNGTSALMAAIEKNDITTVCLLLQKPEIDLELVNKDNQSALMLAIKNDFSEIASILIKAGASQRGIDKYNMSCLAYAKKNKNIDIIQKLSFGEDEDLEKIKNKIISKLNYEIQYLEDSIQESLFINIDKSAKNNQKMKISKISKPVNNIKLVEDALLKNQNIPDFKDKSINHVLLNDDFLIPLKKVEKNKLATLDKQKKQTVFAQEEIENNLIKNLIYQLESKFEVKLKPSDLRKMDFRDIILTSIFKKRKQLAHSKLKKSQEKINLNAMKANEE